MYLIANGADGAKEQHGHATGAYAPRTPGKANHDHRGEQSDEEKLYGMGNATDVRAHPHANGSKSARPDIRSSRIGAPGHPILGLSFTRDIGSWWQSHPLFELARGDDGVPRFDPAGPGGRLVTRFADGREWEIGRVHAWEPGERLAFGWRVPSFAADQTTEVEVRFDAVGAETRVTVEHRGWDQIQQSHAARHGFDLMLFQRRLGEHWRGLLAAMGRRL